MRYLKQHSVRPVIVILLVVMGISATATSIFFSKGMTTWFVDGISRVMIAKQIVSGFTPGITQSGTWWLPLPHIAMTPFVIDNDLYQTAIAGSLISMFSYTIAAVFLYNTVVYVTRDTIAGLIAVVAFSGPNILFMQSVPMSEMTYIASFVVCVHYLVRWTNEPDCWWHLIPASFAAMAAMMTRYEALALIAGSASLVVVVLYLRKSKIKEIEGTTLFYLFIPVVGILLWLAYNLLIFGDPLNFAHGEFAASGWGKEVTLALKPQERAAGNLGYSFLVYLRTVMDNAGWALAIVSIGGVIAMYTSKLPNTLKLSLTLFLSPFVIYPMGMYQGDWIVIAHPDYMSGTILNLRFGTFAIAGIAFFAAFLVAKFKFLRIPMLILILASTVYMFYSGKVSTIEEAYANQNNEDAVLQKEAGLWLKNHWDGGIVLRQRVGNELVAFTSEIPFDDVIYEGNQEFWNDSLVDPLKYHVKWIFMRQGTIKDKVSEHLQNSQVLAEHYTLAYENQGIKVYMLRAND